MYFGICQWNLPVKGPKGCYELVRLGLDGMELDFTEEFMENIDAYAAASKETGVIFPSLGMNIFCNNSYITKNSEDFFEQEIEKALKCASKLGIKTLQIPAFGVSDISNDEELQMAAKNLRRACELAEEYGIYIGTENALDENDNKRLFQMVDHKLFCFYFDNQNLWRMKGKRCAEVIRSMKDCLIEAHAKDSLVINGKQNWKPLGMGDGEFYSSMEYLKEIGYQGWIHLENDYQDTGTQMLGKLRYTRQIKRDLATLKKIFE